jgi:hypothetical protein
VADEPRRTIDAGRALGAPVATAPDIVVTRTPPDPPAMVERSQWVFDLRWDRGDVFLVGVHPLELPAPQATPRVMGRFALELFEGPTLIERARFDFPLLGAEEPDAALSFTPKLRTRIGVVFPATQRRWALPWPVPSGEAPVAPAAPAEAGAAPAAAQPAGAGPAVTDAGTSG